MDLPVENQRINDIIAQERLIPATFADRIGIDRSTIINLLRGRTNKRHELYYPEPSVKVLQNILNTFPDINPDWLNEGKGTMYKNDKIPLRIPEQSDLFAEKPNYTLNDTVTSEYHKENRLKTPEKPIQNIETQQIDIPKLSEKKIEQIVLFYSDGTCKRWIYSD